MQHSCIKVKLWECGFWIWFLHYLKEQEEHHTCPACSKRRNVIVFMQKNAIKLSGTFEKQWGKLTNNKKVIK